MRGTAEVGDTYLWLVQVASHMQAVIQALVIIKIFIVFALISSCVYKQELQTHVALVDKGQRLNPRHGAYYLPVHGSFF